jgi:hypothetical protein
MEFLSCLEVFMADPVTSSLPSTAPATAGHMEDVTNQQTATILGKLMATDWVAWGRSISIFVVVLAGAIASIVAALKPVPADPVSVSPPIINVQPANPVVPPAPVVVPVVPPAPDAPLVKLWLPDASGETGKGSWVMGRIERPILKDSEKK